MAGCGGGFVAFAHMMSSHKIRPSTFSIAWICNCFFFLLLHCWETCEGADARVTSIEGWQLFFLLHVLLFLLHFLLLYLCHILLLLLLYFPSSSFSLFSTFSGRMFAHLDIPLSLLGGSTISQFNWFRLRSQQTSFSFSPSLSSLFDLNMALISEAKTNVLLLILLPLHSHGHP